MFCRPALVPGFKFERVGAPQPAEMAGIAADRALEMLRDVDKEVVPWFKNAASAWLQEVSSTSWTASSLADKAWHTVVGSLSAIGW